MNTPPDNNLRRKPRAQGLRIVGVILLALAAVVAWQSNWFRPENDLSHYPELTLDYTNCQFEQVSRTKGLTIRQIVLTAGTERYEMEDGVWRGHFEGTALAAALAAGGTVHVWVHPRNPHTLRGITGGKVEIPLQWGLDYDQRNLRSGIWATGGFALAAIALLIFGRR